MRPIIIDDGVKNQIAEVIEYAQQHVYTMDNMLDVLNGDMPPAGDNPNLVVNIPHGLRVVYSEEEQQIGRCKHISVSVNTPGKLPNPVVVEEVLKLFKIESPMYDCVINVKDITPEHQYIDIVEPPRD